MSLHRVFLEEQTTLVTGLHRISGDEAQHALRVKRLETGASVELLDGQGGVGVGRLANSGKTGKDGWFLEVEVERVVIAPRVAPMIHVRSAVPKGPRLAEMIESLSQVGAASWGALSSARSVTEAGDHKLERLRRVAMESAKQCGRAWALEIVEPATLPSLLERSAAHGREARESACRIVMADAAGGPANAGERPESALVLIGPEGGWEPREIDLARVASASMMSFGPHVMRIEVAAPVAVTRLLAAAGV